MRCLAGQLAFTVELTLPPEVKCLAVQVNLAFCSLLPDTVVCTPFFVACDRWHCGWLRPGEDSGATGRQW
jgi:hypothetical protein